MASDKPRSSGRKAKPAAVNVDGAAKTSAAAQKSQRALKPDKARSNGHLNGKAEQSFADAPKATVKKRSRPTVVRDIESAPQSPRRDGERRKPVIIVEPGEMDAIADKAMQHLTDCGINIFQRGSVLVRPIIAQGVDSKGRKVRVPALMEVDRPFLRKMLCRHIDWFKPDARCGDGFRRVDAPDDIAKAIMSSAGHWSFRTIAGIISTPTLRFDGSILSSPGYDPSTHLYLDSDIVLPTIPEHPTMADAVAALNLLEDLIVEFPFVNEASRSVSLSAMLSALARSMFDVVPAHGARAPAAGTGKSYLFDIVAAIVLGETCPVINVSSDGEGETEKRIIGMALSGQTIIPLDNVNGTLGGDALCQVIERPTCSLRPLGQSDPVRIENRSIVFFNGNNCRVTGDMTRRVILADLDARVEKPAERVFSGNPVAKVMADRGKYIAACMTMLRAYIAAGSPKQPFPPMNSFGEWSSTVRSALVWLGKADPCETVQRARDEDPELQRLAAFISAAKPHADGSDKALPVSKLIDLASKVSGYSGDLSPTYPDLQEFMQEFVDRGDKPNALKVSRWLGKFKGRVIGDEAESGYVQMRINSVRDTHRKRENWFIETLDHNQTTQAGASLNQRFAGDAGICGVESKSTQGNRKDAPGVISTGSLGNNPANHRNTRKQVDDGASRIPPTPQANGSRTFNGSSGAKGGEKATRGTQSLQYHQPSVTDDDGCSDGLDVFLDRGQAVNGDGYGRAASTRKAVEL